MEVYESETLVSHEMTSGLTGADSQGRGSGRNVDDHGQRPSQSGQDGPVHRLVIAVVGGVRRALSC